METYSDYLNKTESAVRKLFDGITSYVSVLNDITQITFVSSYLPGPEQEAEFKAWVSVNADRLEVARVAQQQFRAEAFALDSLCGALLQVADKAIEIYSVNKTVPASVEFIKPQYAKFCVGRLVRTVPLGLIIYSARNQHTHFNDKALREPSFSVFKKLATAHGYGNGELLIDPAFDLSNSKLISFASNVTALIGWRSYEAYKNDMNSLLES